MSKSVVSTFAGFGEIWRRGHATALACLAIGLMLLAGTAASGQATNGTVAGSVVDESHAAISDAKITLTSLQTGDTRTATTNKAGGYRIEAVPPGTYKVVVVADTFDMTTVPSITVNASVVASVDVTMKVGSAATSIEVSAYTVAALQTESGELSNTLTSVEVNNLPINSLNPYELAITLPGVSTITGGLDLTNGASFSVNGNRPRDNNFLVEGVDNNDQGIHGQAFEPENIEAVQEITFLLNSFSAEYGRGGSVSNLLLKSGSNSFHGAVYERLLNSALDGSDKNDVLNGNPKAKSRENLFGFRIGGPIKKDRLFFFVSNQWDRVRSTANADVLILPTAAGFTTLSTYNSRPQVANLLSAYGALRGTNANYARNISLGTDPVTKLNRGTVALAGVQRQLPGGSNSRELEATGDYIATQSDKLHFRFIQSPLTVPYDVQNFGSQLPGFDTEQSGVTYQAGITYTKIFSPNLVNELRPAWSRIGFGFALRPETINNPLAKMPAITITDITGYGVPSSVPQGRFQNTYQLEDALSWTKGQHNFKFGFDLESQRIRDQIPFLFYGSINYDKSSANTAASLPAYTGLGNFIDDFGGTATNANITYGNPTARPTIWVQNYFAQDSWKVAHNFSFDFGLRYEYYGAPFNYLPNPAINPANPAAFPGGLPEIPNKKDFAPRAGFNYSADSKTVISGGVGLFYSHIFTNVIDNIQGSSPNAAAKQKVSSSSGRGTGNWSNVLNTITDKNPVPADTSNIITQRLKEPLSYEYNLRVQRQLPAAFTFTVQYVGNRSQHQYGTTEFNPYVNVYNSPTRIVSARGRMILQDNSADSNYNALQTGIERKAAHGLTLRGWYTYSKMLDDGSEIFTNGDVNLSTYPELQYPNNRRREYGASAFDHRNRIVVSAVYTPPTWHAEGASRWAAAVVNGWSFAGDTTFQSGQPVNIELGYDWNGDGISNDRPILLNKKAPIANWAVKGDDAYGFGFTLPAGTLCDGPAAMVTSDPCHVVSAANTHWVASHFGTTENTVARNALFTDHISNTDASIERSFHTIESQDFMIRVEALNVFNHGTSSVFNTDASGCSLYGSLVCGVPYQGNVTFQNKPLTVGGNRELRIYARYQF